MKKKSTQARDRQRVLAAIRAEQKHVDLEAAADSANYKADEIYNRMVDGKDLKGLRELDAIFKDLRGSFRGSKSEAFKIMRQVLKDEIDDELMVMKMELSKDENTPDPGPATAQDRGRQVTAKASHQGHDKPNCENSQTEPDLADLEMD